MKKISKISIKILLPLLVLIFFIILWSVMIWQIYHDSNSELITSSIEFVSQDLALLQREIDHETGSDQFVHFRTALSRRGVNPKYSILSAIDEKGTIIHATQLMYTGRQAKSNLPGFDLHRFTKIQKTNRVDIHLDTEHPQINVYYPLILFRQADEIRPSSIGGLYAVYNFSYEQEKILNNVKSYALDIGLLLFLVAISLIIIINYYITRPIKQLVSMSVAIAENKSVIINSYHGIGELAVLEQEFNIMKEMLEARFKEQKQAEEKLKEYSEHLEELVLKRTQELTQANEHLKSLSEIDPLTQIFNRRVYENRLTQEIISAKRSEQPLSLIIIDIDYFKNYNDNYGHDSGDDALKKIALTIKETVPRDTDTTARIGGEEFVVLMPSTNSQGAYLVAENIRTNIKALAIKHESSEVINIMTVSIGISTLSGTLLNEIDLFKQADLALYLAKEEGRNQCKLYEGER